MQDILIIQFVYFQKNDEFVLPVSGKRIDIETPFISVVK